MTSESAIKTRGYLYGGLATTLNIILNALTLGRFLWLEGRVTGGIFRNWAHRFGYRPVEYALPTTEEEIIELIKSSNKLRVFGAGHSFNDGIVSDEVLISLDGYKGVVSKDIPNKRVTVRGGTRIREVVRILNADGLTFSSLPSHDAQSIAGIISTDVHGTGRDWGFVSQLVESIKIIDGNGGVHVCGPADDLFKAAIGGVGRVGIITEVTINAVKRFNIEQICDLRKLSEVERDLNRLIDDNDHVSLYIFPFAEKCQVNIWNKTTKKKSILNELREFINISLDALASSWFGNLMAYTGTLPTFSNIAYRFKKKTDLVMESDKAFTRTIYHLHQEFEFTVPFEEAIRQCTRFLKLFEDMYMKTSRKLPCTLLEVRFTPAGHDQTLIGAGRGRRSCWIDLICNDSHGFEEYYAAAEAVIKEIGGRPHLGKFGLTFDRAYMQKIHGVDFERFEEMIGKHDPDRKFANEFTDRLFG
jgi:hypothetical protein